MGVEIQFCIKNYPNSGKKHLETCPECGEGVLYYPDVNASDIKGNMETFYAQCRCTQCDQYKDRNNTAPRYLTWRVVVRV